MSFSTIAATEAIARQDAAFKRAMDARMARRRQAMGSRGSDMAPADEELACPKCRERFLFGNECPECHIDLRSESLLPEVYEAPAADTLRYMVLGAVVALVMFGLGFASVLVLL